MEKGRDTAEEIAGRTARQRVASLAFDPVSSGGNSYNPMSHRL